MLSKNKQIFGDKSTSASPQPEGGQRYVYIWTTAFTAMLQGRLARKFKSEFGWRTILVTPHVRDLPGQKRYNWSPDDFDEILDIHDVLKARTGQELPNPMVLSEACTLLEMNLGLSALDLVRCDRHLGLGFITSTWFHRSRYGKSTNHQQSLDIAVRLCRYFEEKFAKKPPSLIVGGAGGIASNAFVSVAETKNIPVRSITGPRRGNHFYWQANRYCWPFQFKKDYETNYHRILETMTETDLDGMVADVSDPERVVVYRDKVRNRSGFLDLINNCYNQIRHTLPQRLRRWEPRYGDYLTRDKVWFEFLRWIRNRQKIREPELFSRLPQGVPFIFYPLTMEPETTLQVAGNDADFQLGQIDMLAKTAPAGWNVVIKEHPGQPILRRRSFRDIIGRYPNVLQAGAMENAEQYINCAAVVVTVIGTIGMQAASRGKPVITFSKNYQMAVMPHVRIANSYEELRASFHDVQDNSLPPLKERRAAIEAFQVTMARHEFAITHKEMIACLPSSTALLDEEFEVLFIRLLDGVEPTATAKPAISEDATPDRVE